MCGSGSGDSHNGHGPGRVQNTRLDLGTIASNNITSEHRFGAGNRIGFSFFYHVYCMCWVAPIQSMEALRAKLYLGTSTTTIVVLVFPLPKNIVIY